MVSRPYTTKLNLLPHWLSRQITLKHILCRLRIQIELHASSVTNAHTGGRNTCSSDLSSYFLASYSPIAFALDRPWCLTVRNLDLDKVVGDLNRGNCALDGPCISSDLAWWRGRCSRQFWAGSLQQKVSA